MNNVFVLDTNKQPLAMCHPARARALLKAGRAAVLRRYPFVIILKDAKPEAAAAALRIKLDPGSKTTGIVLVDDQQNRVAFAAELQHRGQQIKKALADRRMQRRNRRSRKTRYRAARFLNRRKPEGWLPPSLQHRVDTAMTWVRRLMRYAPVAELSVERVKFDMQLMQHPDISGVAYQQGELAGYELREYLLLKFNHRCAYCDEQHAPLTIDHVVARASGGSDRVSNLVIACYDCNQKKGKRPVAEFLARQPERLKRVLAQLKAPLKDAAAVNATRNALFEALLQTGLPVETGSGGRTKYNRVRLGYPKAHWIDAACVGASGERILLSQEHKPLRIKACGHGVRQRCRSDAYGFPRPAAPREKTFAGYQTGDLVRANIPAGKYAGRHSGRIAIRHRPSFRLSAENGAVFDVHPKYLTCVQRADGYAYA